MLNFMDCLCLTCEKEPDCDVSKTIRQYQMYLLGEKWIWDRKVYIDYKVTSCPDYSKVVKKIRRKSE